MSATFEWVRDLAGLDRLRDPWNELVTQGDVDHACMRHEWFATWVRTIGKPEGLFIGVLRSDGQIVGIAPMYLTSVRLKGVGVRVLRFLSSGLSPRCSLIVHPDHLDADLYRPLLATRSWDLINLRNVPVDSTGADWLLAGLEAERVSSYFTRSGRNSPYVLTDGDFETYWKSRSRNLREGMRTKQNRLTRKAESHEVRTITDGDGFDEVFDDLVRISSRSWKAKLQSDLGSREELRRFYREFSRVGAGLFKLWVLYINGRAAAFDYYLRSDRSLSLIRNDYDREYDYYSPGNCLRTIILKDLFARPETWEYDMGGQDYGYKMQWTTSVRKHVHILAATDKLRGQIVIALWKSARQLRDLISRSG